MGGRGTGSRKDTNRVGGKFGVGSMYIPASNRIAQRSIGLRVSSVCERAQGGPFGVNISLMWCVVAAREQGPDSGWAAAAGVIGATGFVLVRVARTLIAVALRVVGVVRAPDVLGELPGPVASDEHGQDWKWRWR